MTRKMRSIIRVCGLIPRFVRVNQKVIANGA